MQATLTHNGISKSLTFPIASSNGTPLFSVDVGKPELNFYTHGELQPRFLDTRSGIETYSITTQFVGPSAYQDAITLADIIKSRQGANGTLTFSVSGDNLPNVYPTSPVTVAPGAGQAGALSLTYPPGTKNVVTVDLGLSRVNDVRGVANQEAVTPTNEGSTDGDGNTVRGPLILTDGTTTVDMTENVEITREVGRPNSTVRSAVSEYPNYIDQRKTASDTFSIQFRMFKNAQTKVVDLASNLIQPQLGREPLTLNFQGLYGMGSFNVVPNGSQALRYQRTAGSKDIENIPTVSLRRVI